MKKEHTQQTETGEGYIATVQRDHDHNKAQER